MASPPRGAPGLVNAANLLTFWRIAGTPLFIAFFLTDALWAKVAVLALGLTFELSDVLDGFLARRMQGASDFGALFDPFADSVSRFTIFLCYLQGGYAHLWMVAVLFFRDSLVSFLRIQAARQGVVLSARLSGKLKAVVQGSGIFVINGLVVLAALGRTGDPAPWALAVMTAVTVVTALSGADYLWANLGSLRASMARGPEAE